LPVDPSTILIPISNATPLSPKIAIGGTGANSGAGNTVRSHEFRCNYHSGINSDAIMAQSIGGGGGSGGNASPGIVGLLGIGGAGGSSGSGGTVTVTVETGGNIVTSGRNSRGIYASSIGGGGQWWRRFARYHHGWRRRRRKW
jgi:hypothetical protein